VLHVSPGQVRVGLQGQRDNARRHRGARTSASVFSRASVMKVGRHHLPLACRARTKTRQLIAFIDILKIHIKFCLALALW